MGINQVMHNNSVQKFNETVFSNVLTLANVSSKKRAIKYFDEKVYGYFLEKGIDTYFIEDISGDDSILDKLPIVVTNKEEIDYNKQVFYFIKGYSSVKIPIEQRMPFKELIDNIANFKHTNNTHWILYKIIMTAAWCDRINYRVIAEKGFGKDSVIGNFQDLVGDLKNLYGATFANLEYCLKYKLLIFNEMGNLKSDDKFNMQQFLLATGAFQNKYAKKSRATDETKEEYNTSKLSLGIIYNPPSYYIEKGQEFFDTLFTRAVQDRFIPFYFTGKLDETFDAEFDVDKVVSENMQLYKDIISTLLYYRNTPVYNKYCIMDDIEFDSHTRRFERSFLKICDYISEYAKDSESTYFELTYELYKCYKKFEQVLGESLLMKK